MNAIYVMKNDVGIDREYKMVNRKAKAKENALITDGDDTTPFTTDNVGDVVKVDEENGDTYHGMFKEHVISNNQALYHDQYVVLEPTNIVRVGNARFKQTSSCAYKNDLVISLHDNNIYEVLGSYDSFISCEADGGELLLEHEAYIRLEFIEEVKESPKSMSDVIANLSNEVNRLKKRVEVLENLLTIK